MLWIDRICQRLGTNQLADEISEGGFLGLAGSGETCLRQAVGDQPDGCGRAGVGVARGRAC